MAFPLHSSAAAGPFGKCTRYRLRDSKTALLLWWLVAGTSASTAAAAGGGSGGSSAGGASAAGGGAQLFPLSLAVARESRARHIFGNVFPRCSGGASNSYSSATCPSCTPAAGGVAVLSRLHCPGSCQRWVMLCVAMCGHVCELLCVLPADSASSTTAATGGSGSAAGGSSSSGEHFTIFVARVSIAVPHEVMQGIRTVAVARPASAGTCSSTQGMRLESAVCHDPAPILSGGSTSSTSAAGGAAAASSASGSSSPSAPDDGADHVALIHSISHVGSTPHSTAVCQQPPAARTCQWVHAMGHQSICQQDHAYAYASSHASSAAFIDHRACTVLKP